MAGAHTFEIVQIVWSVHSQYGINVFAFAFKLIFNVSADETYGNCTSRQTLKQFTKPSGLSQLPTSSRLFFSHFAGINQPTILVSIAMNAQLSSVVGPFTPAFGYISRSTINIYTSTHEYKRTFFTGIGQQKSSAVKMLYECILPEFSCI